MTICIGALCDDGKSLIAASDSMITNRSLSIQFEHASRKITDLSDCCVALTAGDALAHTELFNIVEREIAQLKSPTVSGIVDTIKQAYQMVRIREIQERFLNPRGFKDLENFYSSHRTLIPEIAMSIQRDIDRYDYGLEILVAGMGGGAAHIYGIYDPGTSECYDAIGFNAIGSGLPHAINTLLARECSPQVSLNAALMIVYESKKAAEKAPGVGHRHTDISIISNDEIRTIPRASMNDLDTIYKQWASNDAGWGKNISDFLSRVETK